MKPKLSIVIPAYNEADRLKSTYPQIIAFFSQKKYSKEIIFVNDGSQDNTLSLLKSYAKKNKDLKIISHKTNTGKGGALKTGILASKGSWVLFMDADLSTPLEELDKFWSHTKKFPIIIGSRKMKGATITQHQNPVRENLGRVFTFLTNNIATKNFTDITCGFKLFQGTVARQLFNQSLVTDWSFDAEILFLAQKRDIPIKELPVAWHNDPRTKVSLLKDGLKALCGLFKIRFNYLRGLYS